MTYTCVIIFLMPKNKFFPILKQLLMVPQLWADQKLLKTIETSPSKVNIERATAICLKKFPKICEKFKKNIFVLRKQP